MQELSDISTSPTSPTPQPEPMDDGKIRAPTPVIIIVNKSSGGNVAGEFLKIPQGGLDFTLPGGRKTAVSSYDILDPEKRGFTHVAEAVGAAGDNDQVYCIVAGGDGTVMWVIEEMFKREVDMNRLSVGIVPFGTGNDFSNVTGWGTHGPRPGFMKEYEGYEGLKRYVQAWLDADQRPYDIWETSVKTKPSEKAGFEFIKDGKKGCTDDHIRRHGIKRLEDGSFEMSKYVCNYFSVGFDARVGVGFDKLRAKSRLINKSIYGWEGAKKLLFKKKGVIGEIVDSLSELKTESSLSSAADGHSLEEKNTVFKVGKGGDSDEPKLMGNPVSLIFMNIPSISGGLDIWKWSKSKMGVTGPKDLLSCPQEFGDGKLECLSYRSGVGFVMEQARAPITLSGRGNRVYQGGQPLMLKFKESNDADYIKGTSHCKGRTYMQVDGEFFVVYEPDTIVVRHHAKVQVLVNNAVTVGCCGA